MEDYPRQEITLAGEWVGHTDLVWSVAFSSDSQYLASSSWDRTIRRYPVPFNKV